MRAWCITASAWPKHATRKQCMAAWLHGCMAAWLHGCMPRRPRDQRLAETHTTEESVVSKEPARELALARICSLAAER